MLYEDGVSRGDNDDYKVSTQCLKEKEDSDQYLDQYFGQWLLPWKLAV